MEVNHHALLISALGRLIYFQKCVNLNNIVTSGVCYTCSEQTKYKGIFSYSQSEKDMKERF